MKASRFILTLGFFNFAISSWAETPTTLFQSEDVSQVEYEAFLKTETQYQSAIEMQMKARPFQSLQKDLIHAFDEAERSFLADTVETAHQNYKNAAQLALENDWGPEERKLIFHCFLRAAQTAVTKETRLSLIEDSIRFDSTLVPDEKLFPPPMVAEWKVRKSQMPVVTLQLPASYRSYDAAFLNGRKIDFKRFALRVPSGQFRLTLLSNQFAAVSRVGTVEEFRRWKPESEPFVSGKCDEAQLKSGMTNQSAALFTNDCVAQFSGSKVTARNLPSALTLPPMLSHDLGGRPAEARSESMFQKPAFWAIAGSVAAILIYSANREKSDSSEATHKTGF